MISDDLTPSVLRTFVSVCQHGSLSRAAEQAGRAQSAVSVQIRRLEEQVGQRLLRRTGRGVVPTTEGEVFLDYASRILALGEMAVSHLNDQAMVESVRVGLSEEVATALLPTALARLRRTHPQLHLDIMVDYGEDLAEHWREGAFDVAVGTASVFADDPLQSWEVELFWACAIDYPLDLSAPVDLISYAEPCYWRRQMIQALGEAGRGFRMAVTSSNLGTIATAVECGLGVALLPAGSIRHHTMRIVSLSTAQQKVNYGLFAVRRRNESIDAVIGVLQHSLQMLSLSTPGVATPTVRAPAC